ncbi:MFS transporter [Trebonia sp.]|uniref:MFS transporter n=1 Tax=Trebonia sp. TaxID=2767075 RepID=UPI0026036C15|nr:MFS transporter [Trebonia sp.]
MTLPGQPPSVAASRAPRLRAPGPGYKWIALSNTTLGVLMASVNASILLIALPDIFRGIGLNPLQPGNSSLLLWLIMGYMVVTAVLVVSFGRLGDMYGRVRMYNLGFAVFTVFSVALSLTWLHGTAGALWLILVRVLQGVGGAMLMANSAAILTDAFPSGQRGLALGLNQVAGIAGSFIGLILGGLLGPVEWHLVFLVSVPFGLFGTVWAYLKLRELGERRPVNLDWWGNITFGVGLVALLTGITYGIEPYGRHTMGWANPWVIAAMAGGVALLAAFCFIETRVRHPMFRMELFRIRAFTAGNLAGLLSGLGRGGLMFILIIWLQGIYLPRHGYAFSQTPLWAGIYMLPLTAGFLLAGPVSGWLSDHFGARPFATGGMVVAAGSFWLLEILPVNFAYWQFALILLVNGIGMGLFASPNRAAIMNSLPPERRGAGSGMTATFQNSSMVLSIGIFFTLIILGLAATLPSALLHGLTAQGLPTADAARVAALPPVSVLFASLLGYNPVRTLLGPALARLSPARAAYLTGRSFFPSLISPAFEHGLSVAFDFAIAACLVAAIASLLRGGKYVHGEQAAAEPAAAAPPRVPTLVPALVSALVPDCPARQQGSLAERIDSVVQRLAHSSRARFGPAEVTPSGLAALAILHAAGPLRIGELAAHAGVTFPTMSRIIDRIVRSGWAQRRGDETDHRASVVSTTGTGEAVLHAARRDRTAGLATALACLDPAEAAALLAALPALESLADQVDAMPPEAARAASA